MKHVSRIVAVGIAAIGTLASFSPGVAQIVAPAPPAPSPTRDPVYMELLKGGRDPLANAFFTPETVMRHQQAIGLTAEQRTAIVATISAAQPRFIEAQWQLEPETAALNQLLQGPQVDEQAVLRQIDRVLDIERQIKRIQIEMLVRIKNQLTAEQQEQLTRLGGGHGLGGWITPGFDASPFHYEGGYLSKPWIGAMSGG
jgi:Spy/CpxP family protein refolding chaperone